MQRFLPLLAVAVQTALTNAKTDKTVMGRNMKKTDALLRDMVMITLRTDLTRIQRTNLETCITVHMHQKESTEDLVRKKVRAVLHWSPCTVSSMQLVCLYPLQYMRGACHHGSAQQPDNGLHNALPPAGARSHGL